MLLKFVYVVFIGVLIALFVGVGIAAFYPAPLNPNTYAAYPKTLAYEPLSASQTAELRQEDIRNQETWKEYDQQNQQYNKNVAIMTVIAAVLIVGFSLFLAKSLLVIADGLLLGGLLTLIYSLIRSFGTQDFRFMFVVVSVGLLVTVGLGYLKLIKPIKGL